MHCPAAADEVVLVESDLGTVLEVVVLLLETSVEVVVEVFTLLELVDTAGEEVDVLTVLLTVVTVLDVLLVDMVFPVLLDLTLAQTNCVCPISQAPFILKDSKTMLSIAFKFAPVKLLKGTVYV